jgi:glycosyltransferase involved in cell wall biosynthesis
LFNINTPNIVTYYKNVIIKKMKIALVIFTRNERENSEKIYPLIPFKDVTKTYVIDGNSTDGTRDFWRKKKIRVYGQKYKGVGGAYESAFRNTKEDALIFFHPDGNMNVKDIPKFVNRLKKGQEFIIATRMIKGAKNEEDDQLFKPRKWFCQILGFFANVIWSEEGNEITDITQGFRAISRNVYQKLEITVPDAIAPDFEQVIKILKLNSKIDEFPTKEEKRIYGQTSMTSFKTGMANIKVFFRNF